MSTPPRRPLAERLAAQQNSLNTPMACVRCGGTSFYESYVNRYARSGYGSAEFRLLTPVSVPIKVCLCGYPVAPEASAGRGGAGTDQAAFYESLEKAQKFFEGQDINRVVQVAASKRELEELKSYFEERLGKIDDIIAAREASGTPSSTDTLGTTVYSDDTPKDEVLAAAPTHKGRKKQS